MSSTSSDFFYMQRAIQLALEASEAGNPPVGSVFVLNDQIIAEGASDLLLPIYNPRGHAEMNAMDRIDPALWPRASEMTCYTTLEPCCMCFGRLIVSGIGRIVFGAVDKKGGSGCLLPHLPVIFQDKKPEWVGPIAPDQCDILYSRTAELFDKMMTDLKTGI